MDFDASLATGGRVVRITTEVGTGERPATGELLFAFHLDDDAWQGAWVDSAHTGTQLMWLEGDGWDGGDSRPLVRGSWPAGEERCGWQVSFEVSDGELLVAHDIVPPGRDPSRGIEWRCRRT